MFAGDLYSIHPSTAPATAINAVVIAAILSQLIKALREISGAFSPEMDS